MLAESIVTNGYLWVAIFVMGLYLQFKGHMTPLPQIIGRERQRLTVNFKVERALAFALGLGVFLVAMAFVYPSLFSASAAVADTITMP